ncbi:hypothetical protein AB0M34_22025 [Nocardia sp. NPDC050193]
MCELGEDAGADAAPRAGEYLGGHACVVVGAVVVAQLGAECLHHIRQSVLRQAQQLL